MMDHVEDRTWRRFAVGFAATAFGLAALLFLFIVTMDPFGIRMVPGRAPTPIMDLNQRFMYPQLVRSGRFDSAIFGTSTIRLLDPDQLDASFGGRFINLGMNAATPWEQMQLADLFLRSVREPKSIVLGLDQTWCEEDADEKKLTFRAFPPWLYDDSTLDDYPKLVNLTALEIAGRVLLNRFGLMPERIPANGFEIFLPDDALYDVERARAHLNEWKQAQPPRKPVRISADAERKIFFPALSWLAEFLARIPPSTAVTLVFPPNHVRAQPVPGSKESALEAACKARITDLAHDHGAVLVDFRLRSQVTMEDTNYWDPLHYRIGIARRIVDDLKNARETGRDAPDGFYRVLNPRRP